MTPLSASRALDQFFLEARARLLDVAAILDRVDRGEGTVNDPRMTRIQQAIETLQEVGTGRAARIQQIFSLEYDPAWSKPEPHI